MLFLLKFIGEYDVHFEYFKGYTDDMLLYLLLWDSLFYLKKATVFAHILNSCVEYLSQCDEKFLLRQYVNEEYIDPIFKSYFKSGF